MTEATTKPRARKGDGAASRSQPPTRPRTAQIAQIREDRPLPAGLPGASVSALVEVEDRAEEDDRVVAGRVADQHIVVELARPRVLVLGADERLGLAGL